MPADKEEKFVSKLKYAGIFNLSDFYNFCYKWLTEEFNLDVMEDKYAEKIVGDAKEVEIEWTGEKKINDFFKYIVKIKFRILGLTKVEIMQDNRKIKTNSGNVEIKVKGLFQKDYEGKFDTSVTKQFLRGIYEKWVIKSNIKALENKLIEECDEFLTQAKAFLDLEGRK